MRTDGQAEKDTRRKLAFVAIFRTRLTNGASQYNITYKYILTYTKFDFINIRSAKYVHVHAYARVCVCVCVCAHAHTHTSAMNGPVAKFNKIFIFLTVVELNSRNLVS